MLGVIIGTASVIAISSVGQGVQKSVEQQIQALGTNLLQVNAGAAKSGNVSQAAGSLTTLTWEDAKAIEKEVISAQSVTAYLQRSTQVVYADKNTTTTVYGADLNYPKAQNTYPQQGLYFTPQDLESANQVAVIGTTVQRTLFGTASPLNQMIRIQGEAYRVIGVMEPKGSQGPRDRDDAIYIPLTTMSARIIGNNALSGVSVSTIVIQAVDQPSLLAAKFQATNLLRSRHSITSPDNDDFRITNQADLVKTFTDIVGLLTVFVIAIAGISLVVGGIGIANIMLVSVVERTKEIGLRKALGATNAAILVQFLAEAVVISTTGGAVGIAIGVVISFGAATAFSFPFVISVGAIATGFGLSFGVGLLAGGLPARNAARLDPITALRSN